MSADPEDVEQFVNVTDSSKEQAQKYLQKAKGDLEQAITMYFEAGGGEEDPAPAPAAASDAPTGADSVQSVENILGLAKDAKGSGKGAGKSGGMDIDGGKRIEIMFFADGFTIATDVEAEPEEEEETPEVLKAPPRRIGMMSLDDLPRETGRGRPKLPKKIPKLGPLRSYDQPENKQFLDDIKAGRVPKELQERDENGQPVRINIAVDDARPRTYEEISKLIEQMTKMKEEMEAEEKRSSKPAPGPALFTGAGQTLSSSAAGTSASAGAGSGACEPTLLALVRSAPPPTVDESKPTTTLQLRLSSGTRVKARLNLDHTVADVWRLVAKEMGSDAFATSSGHELAAGFPPKPLKDTSATLAAADLANASVTHRCR